jgi:hypothetical protein
MNGISTGLSAYSALGSFQVPTDVGGQANIAAGFTTVSQAPTGSQILGNYPSAPGLERPGITNGKAAPLSRCNRSPGQHVCGPHGRCGGTV